MKKNLLYLNILHVLNDGYQVSFVLLLPFIAKDLNISLTQVGILGSMMYMFNLILALPAAYISERIGGFRALILSLVIYALGYIFTSFAPSFVFLFIYFLLSGVGFGIFHPIAFALVTESSTKETRGAEMGKFTAVGDLGRIGIATLVTFIISFIGWRMTSALYGSTALGVFIVLYFFVIKHDKHIHQKKTHTIALKDLTKNIRFMLANLAGLLDNFASSALFVFLPFLLLHKGIQTSILGSLTGAFFVGNFLGKTVLGRLADKVGNTKTFIIAELLMAVFVVLLAGTNSILFIIPISIILGALSKGTAPVVQTFISESVEHHGSFEKAFGLSGLLTNIGTVLAPIILGYVSDRAGITYAFYISALAAGLAVIPALIFRSLPLQHKT